MAGESSSTTSTVILGLFVGGLLGLGVWFIQGNPLWIAGGVIIGLLAALFGGRGTSSQDTKQPGP
jgi:hypothetical protein